MSSFKNSGMLLSEWIKLNQNTQDRTSNRSVMFAGSSNNYSRESNSRSIDNIQSNSPLRSQIRNPKDSSDSNSVKSAQSLPSMYTRKMRLDGFDANAHLKSDNQKATKVIPTAPPFSNAKNTVSQNQWYKMTRKNNNVTNLTHTKSPSQESRIDNNNQTTAVITSKEDKRVNSSTEDRRIMKTANLPVVIIEHEVDNRSENIKSQDTVAVHKVSTKDNKEEISHNSKVESKENTEDNLNIIKKENESVKINQNTEEKHIVKKKEIVLNSTQIYAVTSQQKETVKTSNKVSETLASITKTDENKKKVIDSNKKITGSTNEVKKENIVSEKQTLLARASTVSQMKETKDVKDQKKKNEIKEEKKVSKEVAHNKVEQANKVGTKNSNISKADDTMNKLIETLDKVVENNLNTITSTDTDLDDSHERNELLEKVLSKEFQENVDKFLTSNDYQNSILNSCKSLAK